jgi:hypothetical protein
MIGLMEGETVELDVVPRPGVIEHLDRRWVRHGGIPRREFVTVGREYFDQDDWTIDGQLLRALVGDEIAGFEEDRFASPLSSGADPREAVASLEVLLGLRSPQFEDGRSAILVCSSEFDLYCLALTAEVSFTDDQVTWNRFGVQADASGFREESASPAFRFQRHAYEVALHRLLDRYQRKLVEWRAGPGADAGW